MKKSVALFLLPLLLIGCANQTYSFNEAYGFEITNITELIVSRSVYQSSAWKVDIAYKTYFECDYVLVDFDIDKEYLTKWPPQEGQDDAYVVCVDTNLNVNNQLISELFYISHQTQYMYANSGIEGKSYRSKDKMPSSFILGISQKY